MKEKREYKKPEVRCVKLELRVSPLGTCDGVGGSTVRELDCQISGGCPFP